MEKIILRYRKNRFTRGNNVKEIVLGTRFGKKKDEDLMNEALIEAQKAYQQDEVPIGAVLVDKSGIIVSRAYNAVEAEHSQLAHAEARAIEYATKKQRDWRLDNHWIFVTLEPCAMCMALIKVSRLAGVVYGASSPFFGFHLDNSAFLSVYKRDAFSIIEGIKSVEAADILRQFFHNKRKKSE